MLLTELILSKRGPLAKVWLSAHHERKLSKQQTLGVDVEESVDAILTQDEGPTTLRLSGQLMLGVTRIYSRKVQYLLDDCKETKDRISLAFRPGVVDLPEDQIKASKNAITFSDARNDFDFFDWSWNAPAGVDFQTTHTASQAKILKPTTKEFGAYNFGLPQAPSLYGGTASRQGSHDGETSSHLDSQDFSGIDLDLRLDDFAPGGAADDSFSVEVGRRVGSREREDSVRSELMGARGRDSSVGMGNFDQGYDGGYDGGGDFEQVDLNLDLDAFAMEDMVAPSPKQMRQDSIISSSLSTPPPVSPPATTDADLTPRTAARIAKAPEPRSAPRVKKPRMIRADQELELDDSYFAAPRADSDILRHDQPTAFDPSAAGLMGDDLSDPTDLFLPSFKVGNETMIYAGPAGLAEELRGFFMFPTTVLRRDRAASDEADGERRAKRPRTEPPTQEGDEDIPEDEEVEIGRRQSTLPPAIGADYDNDPLAGGMDQDDSFNFQPDDNFVDGNMFDNDNRMTPRQETPGPAITPMRAPSLAPSRAESVARQVQYGEPSGEEYALAMFDARTTAGQSESQTQSQSQSQALGSSQVTPTKSVVSEARTRGGYSKNTGMAMGLLRRELEVIEGEEEKTAEFDGIAQKASKRAAATFFFELLVLGTRDCVKLEQKKPFEGIEIRGKEKLWEEIAA